MPRGLGASCVNFREYPQLRFSHSSKQELLGQYYRSDNQVFVLSSTFASQEDGESFARY